MKNRIFAAVFLSLFISVFAAVPGFCGNLELRHVGNWGTGEYFDVAIKGNYAYCTADLNGVDILDISSPTDIRKVGNIDTRIWANDTAIKGNYIYLAEEGLRIVDISNPTTPKPVGAYKIEELAQVNELATAGDYAYLACSPGSLDPNTNFGGLLIVDIRDPASPTPVGKLETRQSVDSVYLQGNYAYVMVESTGLGIIDISDPTAPFKAGGFKYAVNTWTCDISVKGDYAYLIDAAQGLRVVDVSNPSDCRLAWTYDTDYWGHNLYIKDNLLFTTWWCSVCDCTDSVKIFDISTPSAPQLIGAGYTPGLPLVMASKGDHLFVADSYWGLHALDISDPSNPTPAGIYNQSGMALGMALDKNHIYFGHGSGGLRVIDISSPGSPKKIADYRLNNGTGTGNIVIHGQYAFVADSPNGLLILDISNPASPSLKANVETGGDTRDVKIKGNYAYTADCTEGLVVVDISTPSNPLVKGTYATNGRFAVELDITDNYAYVVDGGLHIFDISNPLSVTKMGEFKKYYGFSDVVVKGDYAYVAGDSEGFYIVDVSDPSNPREVAAYRKDLYFHAVDINGNYAYLAAEVDVMVVDISSPTSLKTVATYDGTPASPVKIMVNGDYIYLADGSGQLVILEAVEVPSYRLTVQSSPVTAVPVTVLPADENGKTDGTTAFTREYSAGTAVTLTAPELLSSGYLFTGWTLDGETFDNREITVTMDSGHMIEASYRDASGEFGLRLSPSDLHFGGDTGGSVTASQSVKVQSSGPAALDWTVQEIPDWLSVTPASGSGTGLISVSVIPGQQAAGTYSGRFAVAPGTGLAGLAVSQWVDVTLTVHPAGQTEPPFGTFTTPEEETVVSGNVPFTGWVLDDIGVESVNIYLEDGKTLVPMGTAILVEGARPDIEQAYPSYPRNTRAGWSYMMLTHFLPNGGNGTITFHAKAADEEGNSVTLGTKTVTVNNADSVKPFGTLDTPAQGGTASGSSFRNVGWALTPQPNTIPMDGSTIRVWVDGVPVGNIDYNQYRPDVAALFPGYNNTGGAGGSFSLDTTAYSNGVHTISWTVDDDAGNTEGIGSRYFTIWNTTANRKSSTSYSQSSMGPPVGIPVNIFGSVGVVRGYREDVEPRATIPGDNGTIAVEIDQMERLEIHLNDDAVEAEFYPGFQVVGDDYRPLPTGSTFDRKRGIFYWQPGPGFTGEYEFVFLPANDGEIFTTRHITVTIRPGND